MNWYNILSCKKFFFWSDKYRQLFLLIGLISLIFGIYSGLFYAPADAVQQDAYRIIFVHVPCASGGMMIYLCLTIMAIIHWVWKIKLADVIIVSFAPIGATLTAMALITGAIWGLPMWGDWWVWDARLTSCLILFLFYLGIIALRHAMGNNEVSSKACSILVIIGSIDLPIVHYSVNWWNTLHQGSTLLAFKMPAIHSSMLWPLLVNMFGLAMLTFGFGLINAQKTIIQRYYVKEYIQSWIKKDASR